jgi:hypothetical protein
MGSLGDQELVVSMMAVYHLWLARNDVRDTAIIEVPQRMIRRTMFLLEEWRASRTIPAAPSTSKHGHWSIPEVDCHKANADSDFPRNSTFGGGGVVIRDRPGSFAAGACHFFPSVVDTERAELLACQRTIQLAKEACV